MLYNSKKIMQIVSEILGENATGVYTSEDVVNRDLTYDDCELASTLGTDPFYITSTEDYEVFYGMTKLCIYPLSKKENWVIKIPITGVYRTEFLNEEEDEFNENYKLTLVGKAITDVCDEERVIFENSSSDAKMFMSENILIGEYNNIPIYIQEKVVPCNSNCSESFSNFNYCDDFIAHEVDYLVEYNSDFECPFLYNVILKVGLRMAIEIIEEFSDIDDIHNGNYGYNYQGKAVLFDYAGYNRCYHYDMFAA